MAELLDPRVVWESCGGEQAADALVRLADASPPFFSAASLTNARAARLPFYASHRLLDLEFVCNDGPRRAFALHGPDETHWLNARSEAIPETNRAESLALTDATVCDYVRFFFYFVRGDDGAFVLIESPDEIAAEEDDGGSLEALDSGPDAHVERGGRLALARSRAVPLRTRTTDEHGRRVIDAVVAFRGSLFATTLAVAADGDVEMLANEFVATLEALSVPAYLPLEVASDQPDQPRGRLGRSWPYGTVVVPDIEEGVTFPPVAAGVPRLSGLISEEPSRECDIAREPDGTWRCSVCGTVALTPSPQLVACPRWTPWKVDV